MSKSRTKIALLCSLLVFVSGCWDFISIDNTYYIYSLGIDYQDNNYIVYAQLVNLAQLSAPIHAGTLAQDDESWTGIGKGSSIAAAASQIQLSLENNVDWGHLNAIIFTENALRHGVREAFDLLLHYYKLRMIQWIFATDQPLEKVLHTLPIIFRTPYYSLIGSPLNYYRHSSYVRPIRSHRLVQQMHEPGKTVLLPKLNIKHRWSGTNEKNLPSLMVDGLFPLENYRAKTKLLFPEILGLRWLQKDLRNSKLFINKNGNEVAQLECSSPKPKIDVKVIQNTPQYSIQTNPKCRVMTMQIGLKREEIERLGEQAIEHEIRETYLKGLKKRTDIYSLSNIFYRHYPKQWKKNLKLTPHSLRSVHVQLQLTDTGTKKIQDKSEKGK